MVFFFFFQAEDGIRDYKVTGVQTCALPISSNPSARSTGNEGRRPLAGRSAASYGRLMTVDHAITTATRTLDEVDLGSVAIEIGRASCRERGRYAGGAGVRTKKSDENRQRRT